MPIILNIVKDGREHYTGVEPETLMTELKFHEIRTHTGGDQQVALHTNLGSLTVVDRMTGFGHRDTETGFRDPEGKFWLASGMYDVRNSGAITIQDAIEWVKTHANIIQGT